jgi:hypothetical protein
MKKNFTQLIILGAVIVGLVLFLVFNNTSRMNYQLPEVPKVAREDISKITVTSPAGAVELQKDGDAWKIMPQGFPVTKTMIDSMVQEISELSLTELVSDNKEVYSRYNLDDAQKINVTAYKQDQVVRKYDIGKNAPSQHTFIRLDGNQNVYRAKGDFKLTFDKKVDDLRDKTVFSFAKEDVNSIEAVYEGKTVNVLKFVEKDTSAATEKKEESPTATKSPEGAQPEKTKTVWRDAATKKEIDQKFVDSTLEALYNLTCDSFFSQEQPDLFKKEIFKVTVKGQKDYVLTVYDKVKDKDENPAVSAGNPYKFTLASWRVTNMTTAFKDYVDKNKGK